MLLNQVEMIQAIASQRKIGSSCVFVDVLFTFHLYVFLILRSIEDLLIWKKWKEKNSLHDLHS